ncbi:MAG: DNA -binding domain-containing protein [Methylovirgula sp.]
MSSAPTLSITEEAPSEAQLTDYDRAHLPIYLRLLDAATEGTAWEEAARIVLDIDPVREPERAKLAHDTHLARARWLTEHGYRDLLHDGS